MKRIETNNKSRAELLTHLSELQAKLTQLRFDLADKKLKDVSQLSKIKKDIARLLTACNTN